MAIDRRTFEEAANCLPASRDPAAVDSIVSEPPIAARRSRRLTGPTCSRAKRS